MEAFVDLRPSETITSAGTTNTGGVSSTSESRLDGHLPGPVPSEISALCTGHTYLPHKAAMTGTTLPSR